MFLSSVGKQGDLEGRSEERERCFDNDHLRHIRVFSNLISFSRSFESMERFSLRTEGNDRPGDHRHWSTCVKSLGDQ